ncbi:RHS repeat domain-containing protein [Thermoflavimicrobium daqui]|uniref:Teneurin-like YD-shell domain-containing protein n=1 Tax=Thermoflavimicrobium daqui TaxID=2137476 RepID=A0A364K1A6_9BACL|nr:RHS repeat-associated core domain-containing protein [Thermoflavimicrobium daqui]RAL21478.1 hypothetical protein DL897_16105 [Thermoflavimicrobium daqui]
MEPSAFPSGTTHIQIRGYITGGKTNEYSGEYWFDGLQIEEGHYGGYNVVENPNFERDTDPVDKIPDRWLLNGDTSKGDGLDSTEKHHGTKSVKLVGESSQYRSVHQDINIKGDAGAILTISVFSKAQNPNPKGGIYGYIITTYDTRIIDTEVEKFTFHFDKSKSHDWQHIARQIKTTKPFDKVRIYYQYSEQSGTAWFDTAKVIPGSVTTTHVYDATGNYDIKTTDAEGRVVEKTYDTVGNVTSEKQGNSTTTNEYDGLNRLTKVTDAKQGVTQYEYDANGNQIKSINANNKVSTYTYNEQNQVKTATDPLNRTTKHEYDINGNLTKIESPNGTKIEHGYNAVDRQTSTSYNGKQKYTFEYDPNGNVTKETDVESNQVTTFTYDQDNKLKTVNEGNGHSTEYTYDKNGNVTDRKHIAGSTVIQSLFTYNSLNQLMQIKENGADRAWFTYEENDKVASRKNGDGTYSFYRYHGAGDVVQLVNYDRDGNPRDSFVYHYDNKGNITSVKSDKGTITYQYDELDQLVKESYSDGTVYEYTYDAVGNCLSKKVTKNGQANTTTYTYNDANELTAVNGTTYEHDPNGNLVKDDRFIYVYDAQDRLTAVKDLQGNTVASYTYRADGMRKTMTTSSGTITFHYDENKNVIYETDQNNNILASYTYNGIQPVSMTRDGKTYYYQLNNHGDVIALTDSSGAVVATYEYDAYGNITKETGTITNPYRYAGYRYDQETGLYYLQARYYNPDTGRFLTLDPDPGDEDDPKTQNGYNYANNNPVMFVDPDGHWGILIRLAFEGIKWGARTPIGRSIINWGVRKFAKAFSSRWTPRKKTYKKRVIYRPARSSISWGKRVVYRSKGGKQNKRDSAFVGMSEEQLLKMKKMHQTQRKDVS